MVDNNNDTYLNDLFFRYAIFTGKRFRKNEKEKFLQMYSKELSNIGFDNNSFKLIKDKRAVNMYVGDFNKDDIVLVSSYDTPMKILGNKDIFPNDVHIQQKNAIKTIIASMLIFTIIMLISFFSLHYFRVFNVENSSISYIYAAFVIIYSIGISYLAFGIPRKNNFIFNSANLISIVLLSKELFESKTGVSIILTDLSIQRNQGINQAKKFIQDKNLKAVYINSIGKDEIFIKTTEDGTTVSCGVVQSGNVVMKNQLSNDTEVDVDRFQEHTSKVYDTITGQSR